MNTSESLILIRTLKIYNDFLWLLFQIAAIDEKGLDFFYKYINEDLGGWPILDQQLNNISIIDKLIKLKLTESSQIFEVFVSANPKNPTLNILRVKKIT